MKEKLRSGLRRTGLVLVLLLVAFYAVGAWYYLPRTVKVHVTGTEVKRLDTTLEDGTERTRDVRYVMTEPLAGGTMVFRNEDTGWGWPPYFKFNSGDVAGQATNYAGDPSRPVVLATYYGWRINLFTLYPNVVSLRTVDRSYEHLPIFNLLFVGLSLVAFVLLYVGGRRLSKWRPFKKEEAPPAEG